MNDINLPTLVKVIGQALLKLDEQMLETAVTAAGGNAGGILRRPDERMYQFCAYQAMLARWVTKPEHHWRPEGSTQKTWRPYDLAIMDDAGGRERAMIEMKWFWPGIRQRPSGIRSVRKDLDKLRDGPCVGYMIFFGNGHQLPGLLEPHKELPELAADKAEIFTFPTLDHEGKDVEFFVAGWQIKPSPDERTVSPVKDVLDQHPDLTVEQARAMLNDAGM